MGPIKIRNGWDSFEFSSVLSVSSVVKILVSFGVFLQCRTLIE